MKKIFLRVLAVLLCVVCLGSIPIMAAESNATSPDLHLQATSAILMEAETGRVLYEQNADEPLPPASVTKVMTLLLVMEAIDSGKIKLDDIVTTSETAAAMGGSQIYLKVGEQMTVNDLLKSVVIASANDAAAALAEHLCGSIAAFVDKMNEKTRALDMKNTNFENTNGLDDTTVNHYISARDVAIMSRELISHPLILEYSSIWMDTIRDGAFGLTNTNRLVRFYPGATGLKTGSTSKAKFCISATAMRDDMHLIAVIMGAPTRDIRNEEAKKLLDYGFANYAVYKDLGQDLGDLPVLGGVRDICRVRSQDISLLIDKAKLSSVTRKVNLPTELAAPLTQGQKVGTISYYIGEEQIGECDICTTESIEKISFWEIFSRILKRCFLISE